MQRSKPDAGGHSSTCCLVAATSHKRSTKKGSLVYIGGSFISDFVAAAKVLPFFDKHRRPLTADAGHPSRLSLGLPR